MNQKFEILRLEKQNRTYLARVLFDDFIGDYEIAIAAHLSYLEFLPEELRFHILTKEDTSFNGNLPHIKVKGVGVKERLRERGLEAALLEFAKKIQQGIEFKNSGKLDRKW